MVAKHGVRDLGTPIKAIITTEDRELSAKAVEHAAPGRRAPALTAAGTRLWPAGGP